MTEYWDRWWARRAGRRQVLAGGGVAAAGLASLALVGCGDDDDDDSGGGTTATGTAATATGTAATATSTAAVAKPVKGGTIRYPFEGMSSGDPPTLYPYENLSYLVQNPSSMHYSRLVRGKTGPGISPTDFTSLEGDLVQKWEQANDTTYIFTLKPNMKWQSPAPMNGRAITAGDILKSYDAFLAKSQQANAWKAAVDKFEAPDEKTLKITLKEPFAPFLSALLSNPEHFWVIPVETIDNDQVKTKPVGSGPWLFDDYETGVAFRWVRNPNYFDAADFPHYDKVEGSLLKDSQRILAGLAAGELDGSLLSGTIYTDAHAKLDPKGTEYFYLAGHSGFWFNFDNKPWQDPRVRQALSNAMDRVGLLKATDQTGKGDAHSHIGAGLDPFWMSPINSKEWGDQAKYWKYDPAESKKLLQAATGSDTLKVVLISNIDRYGAAQQQMSELLQSTMKAGGFDIELQYMEYATYIQSIFLGKIPEGAIAAGPYIGTVRDPDNNFFSEMHSGAARKNWGGTPLKEQAELDGMMEKQRTILNKEERVKYMKDIQRRMAEVMERVPYTATSAYGYMQPWVKNFNAASSYAVHTESMSKSWFTEERVKKG